MMIVFEIFKRFLLFFSKGKQKDQAISIYTETQQAHVYEQYKTIKWTDSKIVLYIYRKPMFSARF